jgi:hypothetical protein
MEFVHPFPGKTPGDKISKQELISAVRLAVCAEEEAVHLYDTIAEYTDNEKIRKIMKDVADEEQVHVGEFTELVRMLDDDEEEKVDEGEKEAKEKMSSSIGRRNVCAGRDPDYFIDRRKYKVAAMKPNIKKLASGWNSPKLPGRIFASKKELLAAMPENANDGSDNVAEKCGELLNQAGGDIETAIQNALNFSKKPGENIEFWGQVVNGLKYERNNQEPKPMFRQFT